MKTGRNARCTCGSGKKYKKCCMEERQRIMSPTTQETALSNDFRKELEAEKVSDAELMLRDQVIMARAMEGNHRLSEIKNVMLTDSLDECQNLLKFMNTQPVSPGMEDLLSAAQAQVESLNKVLLTPVVSRADAVQLAALKAAIQWAKTGQAVTEVLETHTTDIKAPITDDGLGGDDDDDDESEEEHDMVDPNAVSVKL